MGVASRWSGSPYGWPINILLVAVDWTTARVACLTGFGTNQCDLKYAGIFLKFVKNGTFACEDLVKFGQQKAGNKGGKFVKLGVFLDVHP